ncbi:MAG: hypothetical protein HUJ76_12200, partial [Parasporobacterium sp.]|nr:hypothetical protein [Parasporobacterium sp.]
VLVRIRLQRDEGGRVVLAENNYIPCYCYTTVDECKWAPVALSEGYNASSKKGRKAYNRIVDAVGGKVKPI